MSTMFVQVKKEHSVKSTIDRRKAMQLQKELRITRLAHTLLSPKATTLFSQGYKFADVLRKGIGMYSLPDREYVTLDIDNQWHDKALFSRKVESDREQNGIQPCLDEQSDETRTIRNSVKHSIYEWITEEQI